MLIGFGSTAGLGRMRRRTTGRQLINAAKKLLGFGAYEPPLTAGGQLTEVPMWVNRGSDRMPYYRPPFPQHCEMVDGQNVCIEGAAWYGREAGNFFNSPRRCPVDYNSPQFSQWGRQRVTPRGGIFDGTTVGGPGCTYLSPQPPTVPQLMPPQHEVPQAKGPREEVPFAPLSVPGPFAGVGPDGIG